MENAPFIFRAVEELQPGQKWQRLFEERWPWYRTMFLQEGEACRQCSVASRWMLRTLLPETMPVYERLVALAGGGDVAARLLTLYRPPPYVTACSQGVWTRGAPVLVRNYD